MTRGGRKAEREAPERRCIATGRSDAPSGMIRFVVGPEAQIVPDVLGRLPGRGIWVSAERAALQRAVTRRLFARAARQAVNVPGDLEDMVEKQLARRVVELVSLARKSGQAVCGYEKTRDWLVKGEAAVLLQATDGSPREKSRLRPPEGANTRVGALSAAELGLAFGREHVIHAALAAGGLATRVVEEAARLAGIRGQIGADDAGKD
ncbi:RNA-binding protein [Alkalilacustris brevis]|uniref:RNA-binding protein n=1 Tax=Alkalilacustris brevis TaxID=2026338 RepID=UPI000E0D6848|nr:RNA-binding protein [Alkalilacustris brevis]